MGLLLKHFSQQLTWRTESALATVNISGKSATVTAEQAGRYSTVYSVQCTLYTAVRGLELSMFTLYIHSVAPLHGIRDQHLSFNYIC